MRPDLNTRLVKEKLFFLTVRNFQSILGFLREKTSEIKDGQPLRSSQGKPPLVNFGSSLKSLWEGTQTGSSLFGAGNANAMFLFLTTSGVRHIYGLDQNHGK